MDLRDPVNKGLRTALRIGSCSISAVLCLWLLAHLCRRRRKMRQRLFWIQLFVLATIDLLYCMAVITYYLASTWTNDFSREACVIFLNSVVFLECSSCLLEVHIAAGFAVACCLRCCSSERASLLLVYAIPLSLLGTLAITLQMRWQGRKSFEGQCLGQTPERWAWDTFVGSCCFVAIIFYILSMVWTVKAHPQVPFALWRRAFLRALSYLINFLVTFGPRAIELMFRDPFDWFFILSLVLLGLNGTANVSTYAFWIWRQGKAEERLEAGTIRNALDEPRAVTSDFEQVDINNYFDVVIVWGGDRDHLVETNDASVRHTSSMSTSF